MFSWMKPAQDTPFDLELVKSLEARSMMWRAWHGEDSEGLPTFALWIQAGSFIAEVHINVGPDQEAFGWWVFNHIVKKLISMENVSTLAPLNDERSILPTKAPSPNWWLPDVRADHWEYEWTGGEVHWLATWTSPRGHNPHYHGLGGDPLTCVLAGCIENWVWWTQVPISRLGVPKRFIILDPTLWGDAENVHNYSATVWID
jgi:hypothetical protein